MAGRRPPIAIIYFSETGTAHSLADLLRRQLLRLHFEVTVLDAEDIVAVASLLFANTPDSGRPIVIFLCATTGNGEIPRHARKLWRYLLRKKLTAQSCAGLRFSSFGLGDTAYARYNWAAKKLHKRMLQLGAEEICVRGEGDESAAGGIEHAYSEWEPTLISSILGIYPLEPGRQPIPDNVLLPPEFAVKVMKEGPAQTYEESQESLLKHRLSPTVRLGRVVRNERITPQTHFQDTRAFDIQMDGLGERAEFVPGATLLIYPQNDPASVAALLASQDWTGIADLPLSVPPAVLRWATTKPLTLRTLLTYHLDLTSVPRATFFELLSYFSKGDEQQLEKLRQFSNSRNEDDIQDRYDYADRPRRSVLECLLEFESVRVPAEYVLEVFGQLRPRQFSIAGFHDNRVELLIAIVKYKTILRRIRQGVCTRYVSMLVPGDHLLFEFCPPQTKPPPLTAPVLLIGPGTGVAPLRALLHERLNSHASAQSILVFGNRSKSADFYYEADWRSTISPEEDADEKGLVQIRGNASTVYACFSRDNNRVRYVQDILSTETVAERVRNLIVNESGYVWVCGSKGKMPRAVRHALEQAVNSLEQTGADVVAELDRQGRYLEETW